MSVQLEIERLRSALYSSGLDYQEAQVVCDAAVGDISELLADIVSNGVAEAIDYALNIGADDFIDDIQVLSDSNGFYQISTHSGNLDYSRDRQEMLHHLLKNAKVSQDGHRYKVIPVQQKSKQVQHSMFSVLQARQDMLDDARNALRQRAMDKRAGVTEAIRVNLLNQKSIAKAAKEHTETRSDDVNFRTATDKQNPRESWVIPEKDVDMTDFIRELNQRMVNQAHNEVDNIVNLYYSTYVGT